MSDIFDMEKLSEEANLDDNDIALGDNPQGLTFGEIKKRCQDIDLAVESEHTY